MNKLESIEKQIEKLSAENKIHRNAEASHCRLPSTDVGIDFDAIKCHELWDSFLIRDASVKGYR